MPHLRTPNLLSSQNYRFLLISTVIVIATVFNSMAFWFNASTMIFAILGNARVSAHLPLYLLVFLILGYVLRPIGAFVFGRYSDNCGRKSTLKICLAWLLGISLLMSILPTHHHVGLASGFALGALRLLQGFIFAPILPTLWVLAAEKLPKDHLGIGMGILGGASVFGVIVLLLVRFILEDILSIMQMMYLGWRMVFILGAFFAAVALLFCRYLHESPVFAQTKPTTDLPLRAHWTGLPVVVVLSWFMATLFVILVVLLPDLTSLSFSINAQLFTVNYLLMLVFLMIGSVFFGFLTDRIANGAVFLLGCILFIVSILGLFYTLRSGSDMALLAFVATGFFAGVSGALPHAMVQYCTKHHRLLVFSVGYNTMWALAGIVTPLLLGFLTFYSELAPAVYLCLICILVIFVGFYLFADSHHKNTP